jgi:hypothetical protein
MRLLFQQKFGGCRTSNAVYAVKSEPYDIINTSKLKKNTARFPRLLVHLHEFFLVPAENYNARSIRHHRPLRSEPEVMEQACYRLTTEQPKPGLKYCHENNEVRLRLSTTSRADSSTNPPTYHCRAFNKS